VPGRLSFLGCRGAWEILDTNEARPATGLASLVSSAPINPSSHLWRSLPFDKYLFLMLSISGPEAAR
jgi:hypothetical protein